MGVQIKLLFLYTHKLAIMNKALSILVFLALTISSMAQNVGIGTTTPAASAQLDVSSATKGFLPPRMTTTQRNAGIEFSLALCYESYNIKRIAEILSLFYKFNIFAINHSVMV